MDFTSRNIYILISILSPTLITFYLVMSSIFNNRHPQWIFYMAGGIISTLVSRKIGNRWGYLDRGTNNNMCNLLLYSDGTSPSSTMYLTYTLIYLLTPMMIYRLMNHGLLVVLFIMIVVDILRKYQAKCTSLRGIVVDLLGGVAAGLLWFGCLYLIPLAKGDDFFKNYVYFEDFGSNKPFCKKENTKFKCTYSNIK